MIGQNPVGVINRATGAPTPTGDLMKDIKYVAGLFDGEGSVSIILRLYKSLTRNPCHYLSCGISLTNKQTIDMLQNEFGGKVVLLRSKGNRKPCWRWTLDNSSAVQFLEAIEPYSCVKLTQILVGLSFQGRRHPSNSLPQSEVEIRECYRQAMWAINGLGSRGESHNRHRIIPIVSPTNPARIVIGSLVDEADAEMSKRLAVSFSLPYMAGLFDAEGNVSIELHDKKYHSLYSQISSTNRALLMAICEQYGGNVKRVHGKTANSSELWAWYLRGEKTLEFLKRLRPLLVVRASQTDLGIEFQTTKKRYKQLSVEEFEKRENYRRAIWKLNGSSSRNHQKWNCD